jgi:hypothetical protein
VVGVALEGAISSPFAEFSDGRGAEEAKEGRDYDENDGKIPILELGESHD